MDFLGSNPSDLFIDDYPTEFSWLSSEAFLAGNETFQNISRQLEPSGEFNFGLFCLYCYKVSPFESVRNEFEVTWL